MTSDINPRLENELSTSQEGEVTGQESLFSSTATEELSTTTETTASTQSDTLNDTDSDESVNGHPAGPKSSSQQEATSANSSDTSWVRRHKRGLAMGTAGSILVVGVGVVGAKVATSSSHHSGQPVAEQNTNPSSTASTSQAPRGTNSPSATSIPSMSGTNPEVSYIQPHYNMLNVPSEAEQDSAIDSSDLPEDQKQMAKELVQYGFPFAPGLDYNINNFKAKGLDETKAEKAVFLQLVTDYLAAANTDDPNVIPKMGPGDGTWDTASIKSGFSGVRNNYAFWQVITEDTTGVRDISYTNDGTHITISGTTYLNGVPKTEHYLKDFEQVSQKDKTYLTDSEMHVDFNFKLSENYQLTHYDFTAFNN